MPAELFPFAFVGTLLLIWSALRSRSNWKPFAWGMGVMLLGLLGSQAIAEATGLANGDREPAGWPWVLVLLLFAVYTAALIMTGIAAIFLLRDQGTKPTDDKNKSE